MSYMRIIPRDFFNEAKLLKCLGQLTLHIHDGVAPSGLKVDLVNDRRGFDVAQDESSAALYAKNVRVTLHGRPIYVGTSYNSKAPYPMLFSDYGVDELVGCVFNDDGTFHEDFLTFCEEVSTAWVK